MSRLILGLCIATEALLLLGSAYLLAGDSAAGAALLAFVGVSILLSGVRLLGPRRLD